MGVHKGLLEIDDELEVLRTVGEGGPVGLTVNWGRSAIEGRSAATPLEHVSRAAGAGLLAGLMFSGATGSESAWGPAWDDGHIAPYGDAPALAASSASLLGRAETAAALTAAGPGLGYVGVKVTTHPEVTGASGRLAVGRASVELVSSALAGS